MKILLLMATLAHAQTVSNPQYQLTGKSYASEASAIQQMFYNLAGVIQRITKIIGGGETVRFINHSLTEIQGIIPTEKGQTYYCTTCSPPKLVTSTGTAAGNFADAAGGAFK